MSDVQIEAFRLRQAETFVLRIVSFLKQQLPEYAVAPHDKAVAAVSQLVDRARSFGLETEREIIIFVLAAHYLGGDFDTAIAACRTTLADPSRTPAWKADWLEALSLIIERKREMGEL